MVGTISPIPDIVGVVVLGQGVLNVVHGLIHYSLRWIDLSGQNPKKYKLPIPCTIVDDGEIVVVSVEYVVVYVAPEEFSDKCNLALCSSGVGTFCVCRATSSFLETTSLWVGYITKLISVLSFQGSIIFRCIVRSNADRIGWLLEEFFGMCLLVPFSGVRCKIKALHDFRLKRGIVTSVGI